MSTFDIKQINEESICRCFLSIYNRRNDLKFSRQGDPNKKEPDCICSNNTAIELVGIYDNQYQAEKMRNEARGKDTKKQPNFLLLTPKNLQTEIAKKLEKLNNGNYNGFSGKIILVCCLKSPLLTTNEVKNYVAKHVPFREDNHFDKYFDEIWLLWKTENIGNWEIEKIE